MWQQDEAFPASGASALPPSCRVARLCPGLGGDARGRRASPGSGGGERLLTGSCDGAELAERWVVSVGLG